MFDSFLLVVGFAKYSYWDNKNPAGGGQRREGNERRGLRDIILVVVPVVDVVQDGGGRGEGDRWTGTAWLILLR